MNALIWKPAQWKGEKKKKTLIRFNQLLSLQHAKRPQGGRTISVCSLHLYSNYRCGVDWIHFCPVFLYFCQSILHISDLQSWEKQSCLTDCFCRFVIHSAFPSFFFFKVSHMHQQGHGCNFSVLKYFQLSQSYYAETTKNVY